MSDCFFEPCPDAPEEVEITETVDEVVDVVEVEDDGEMDDGEAEESGAMEEMEEDDMSADMKNELRMANLAFLMMAGMSTAWAAIDLFAWKWQVTYTGTDYDGASEAGQVLHYASGYTMINTQRMKRDYWRLGALIGDYATLAIMGTATITQLLSMFAAFGSINMMVWHYGVMMAGGLVSMIVGAMWMWAYRTGMSDLTGDSTTNAASTIGTQGSNAYAYTSAIEMDMVKAMAHEASATLTAWEYMESWMKAQYHAMTPEEQAMWKEDKEGEMSSDMGDEGAETTAPEDETDETGESQDEPEPETAEESAETADDADLSFEDFLGLFRKKVFRF